MVGPAHACETIRLPNKQLPRRKGLGARWESKCWLDLAKGGLVGGIPLIALKSSKMSISWFLADVEPIFKIPKI